jgi:hypothetical protein
LYEQARSLSLFFKVRPKIIGNSTIVQYTLFKAVAFLLDDKPPLPHDIPSPLSLGGKIMDMAAVFQGRTMPQSGDMVEHLLLRDLTSDMTMTMSHVMTMMSHTMKMMSRMLTMTSRRPVRERGITKRRR